MALTKVTGQVILPTTDLTVGVLTVTNTLAVGGTVSVGGTLTYEDVTNVDSVGLITARNGIVVGSGITLSKDGDGFFTGIVTATTLTATTIGAGTSMAAAGLTGALPSISGANLTGITQTTINNNANNRVITGSGTANTLEGETNLTFDGTGVLAINVPSATGEPSINFENSDTGSGSSNGFGIGIGNAESPFIYNRENTDLRIGTNNIERVRITAAGKVGIGEASPDEILHINSGTSNGCLKLESTDAQADLYIVDNSGAVAISANGDNLLFQNTNSQTERVRIDSGGRLLVGHTASIGNMGYGGSGIKAAPLQVVSADSSFNNGAAIINYRDGSGSPAIPAILRLALSRSDTKGGNGIVLNGDTVAAIQFQGNDGSNFRSVARIDANVDGAPGSDDMPGRLQFLTTSDGAYSPTERVRITSSGKVWVNRTSGSFIDIEGTAVNPDVSGGAWDGQVMIRSHNSATVGDGAGIRLMNTNGSKETAGSIAAVHTSGNNGDLAFYTYSGGAQHWERMRISHSGNGQSQILSRVMIGRSDPIHHAEDCLTVYGGEDDGVAACFRNSGNGGGVLYYANNNNAMAFQVLNSSGNETFKVTGTGTLSKASGSFKIDHPLDSKKDSHYLQHSFIEGPQADLIYRGIATLSSGTATVNIDTAAGMTEGTFVALVTDVSCFTSNESDWTAVKGSVSGNTLTITAQDNSSTAKVSWLVIGERCDAHMKDTNTDWTDNDGKVIVELSK